MIALEHAYTYNRSVRAFGINLPLCDSQPIIFFFFSPFFLLPSLPFVLRFFRFSSSFSFSARTRFLPLLLRPIPSFPFDKSLPEIPTKNHVVRSFVRAPDTRLVGLAFAITVFSFPLLPFLFPPIFPNGLHNRAFSRKTTNDFFAHRPPLFPPFLLLAMNHKFGGARREARAASCNARKTEAPLCVPFIYPSTITP